MTPPAPLALPSPARRKRSIRLIRECVGGLGWKYRAYLIGYIAISLIFLLPPLLLELFTTGVTGLDATPASDFVRDLVVFGLLIALTQWFGIFVGSVLSEWLRLTVSIGLRRQVMGSLHRTRIESLDTAHRGDWLTRMTSDLRNCEGFISDSLPEQVRNASMMAGVAALFIYKSGWIALIPIAAGVFLYALNVHVQRRMAPVLGRVRMLEGSLFQQMIESFEGLRTIRSYGGEESTTRKVNRGLEELFAAGLHIIRRMGALMGLNEFAGQAVITLVLTVAALAVNGGTLTATDVLVYPFFIGMFLNATKSLVAATYEWNRFFIEGGRLASLLYDEENLLPEPATLFGDLRSVTALESLEASGVTVGYGDGAEVVARQRFRIDAGEIVAIMGPSGCGKSTFLEVLAGLRMAHSGTFRVRADGTEFGWQQLPVFLSSYVEQRPYLFVGSIRENLTLGLADQLDDDEIMMALEGVGLADVIRARGGVGAILTDRGLNLSEGQRYRLALVRALLARRPVILLDEPFAALDDRSIAAVVSALRAEAARGAAVAMVTHLVPKPLGSVRIERLGEAEAPRDRISKESEGGGS